MCLLIKGKNKAIDKKLKQLIYRNWSQFLLKIRSALKNQMTTKYWQKSGIILNKSKERRAVKKRAMANTSIIEINRKIFDHKSLYEIYEINLTINRNSL